MKILRKITNGVFLILIGVLHTLLVLSPDVCGKQFQKMSETFFFKISNGPEDLPMVAGKTNCETFAAFWFFYFGILLIPLGLLVHSMEKGGKTLPFSFTLIYLIVVLIGCYMIPNSGMTFIMLPHAIYMLISNIVRVRKNKPSDLSLPV